MGWKRIGNHSYYYRSRRVGRRVVTEYVGAGDAAAFLAGLDAEHRRDRETERLARKDERDEARREDSELAEWFDRTERVAELALVVSGYHKHRGQWRRRRDGGNRGVEGEIPGRVSGADEPGGEGG